MADTATAGASGGPSKSQLNLPWGENMYQSLPDARVGDTVTDAPFVPRAPGD
jgi:hypothetical protein